MEEIVQRHRPQLEEIARAHAAGEHEVLPNAPKGYCRDCSRQLRAWEKAMAEECRAKRIRGPRGREIMNKYARR